MQLLILAWLRLQIKVTPYLRRFIIDLISQLVWKLSSFAFFLLEVTTKWRLLCQVFQRPRSFLSMDFLERWEAVICLTGCGHLPVAWDFSCSKDLRLNGSHYLSRWIGGKLIVNIFCSKIFPELLALCQLLICLNLLNHFLLFMWLLPDLRPPRNRNWPTDVSKNMHLYWVVSRCVVSGRFDSTIPLALWRITFQNGPPVHAQRWKSQRNPRLTTWLYLERTNAQSESRLLLSQFPPHFFWLLIFDLQLLKARK